MEQERERSKGIVPTYAVVRTEGKNESVRHANDVGAVDGK